MAQLSMLLATRSCGRFSIYLALTAPSASYSPSPGGSDAPSSGFTLTRLICVRVHVWRGVYVYTCTSRYVCIRLVRIYICVFIHAVKVHIHVNAPGRSRARGSSPRRCVYMYDCEQTCMHLDEAVLAAHLLVDVGLWRAWACTCTSICMRYAGSSTTCTGMDLHAKVHT